MDGALRRRADWGPFSTTPVSPAEVADTCAEARAKGFGYVYVTDGRQDSGNPYDGLPSPPIWEALLSVTRLGLPRPALPSRPPRSPGSVRRPLGARAGARASFRAERRRGAVGTRADQEAGVGNRLPGAGRGASPGTLSRGEPRPPSPPRPGN